MAKPVEQKERVVIRFAGDSGDGMQLTGGRFASETALFGNDLSTLPDFPAEIRAPAGSLPGVSGFQIHFSDHDILTPGDAPDVLVAMNPAALKTNLRNLPKGATVIVDTDAFNDRNLQKAGYAANPLEDDSLAEYQVQPVPLTSLTLEALKEFDLTRREGERSKNMFALGLMSWLYSRPTEGTVAFLEKKFAKRPELAAANVKAFRAGYAFGETTEELLRPVRGEAGRAPARHLPQRDREPGARDGARRRRAEVGPAALPRRVPDHAGLGDPRGARALQALRRADVPGRGRDRRRRRRASARRFGGALGVCTSSGPGVVLKAEAIGLAVTLELPLLVLDIQRAGPVDRNADEARAGGSPHGAVRPQRRVARARAGRVDAGELLRHGARGGADLADLPHARCTCSRTPTSRTGPSRGSCPDAAAIPEIPVVFATEPNDGDKFLPYVRDEKLARQWAIPGHARPRASRRRPREGGAHRATSRTTPTTTT